MPNTLIHCPTKWAKRLERVRPEGGYLPISARRLLAGEPPNKFSQPLFRYIIEHIIV